MRDHLIRNSVNSKEYYFFGLTGIHVYGLILQLFD